jgi:hypothetical protein
MQKNGVCQKKMRYAEKGMKKNEVCKENRKMRCAEKDMQKHIL